MAVIEFINRKNKTAKSLNRVIAYILREDKTQPHLVYCEGCSPQTAYDEFIQVKKQFCKETGRQYIHFVQSFSPEEKVTPEIANEIAKRLITLPQFAGFQIVLATHIDTGHIHTHFVINAVNSETGLKWQQTTEQLQELKDYSDELCREYGLTVIESKNKGHRKGGEYRSKEKGCSWKYELFLAVKSCMRVAVSKDDFIAKMDELGYTVIWDDNKNYITFITPEGKKCRNRKLYPPEMFTKENLLKNFERNRQYQKEKERSEFWNNLISVLSLFRSRSDRQNHRYPLSSLEGEALKDKLLENENEGRIRWDSGCGNEEFDYEV